MEKFLIISTNAFPWTFRLADTNHDKITHLFELMDYASHLSLNTLQLADNFALQDFSESDLNSINQEANRRNITLEIATQWTNTTNLLAFIDIANHFDTSFLRLSTDHLFLQTTVDEIIETINSVSQLLRHLNMMLAIENSYNINTSDFLKIFKNTDNQVVSVCYNPTNTFLAGYGLETDLLKLEPYISNIIITDYLIKSMQNNTGFRIEGVPAGLGKLNIPLLINLAKEIKCCKSIIFEQWINPELEKKQTLQKEKKWADQGLNYLKKNLKTTNI